MKKLIEKLIKEHFSLDYWCHYNNNPLKNQHLESKCRVQDYNGNAKWVDKNKLCVGYQLMKILEYLR